MRGRAAGVSCVCVLAAALGAGSARAESDGPNLAVETLDGRIVTPAGTFDSWGEYLASDYFREVGARCGAHFTADDGPGWRGGQEGASPADCTLNLTNPDPIYGPIGGRYRIQVVVHVIQNTSGAGFISEEMVQSQIDILNEDFLALAGSNGGLGHDGQIEFYLATEDPSGNPTNGITYSTNNTWYNDGGAYYNTLFWDTSRYLNIYTNTAGGALGYVPGLPQGGVAGSPQDRVVILWTAFGRNSSFVPYDQGRTATHEVGHYLGLYHPFDNGCGTVSGCYTTGDRVCDTPRESSPSFGCPAGKSTCGEDDPEENYMDYSDDLCMTEFTVEQILRMRCTMQGYRPDVYQVVAALCGNDALDEGEQCDDGNQTSGDGCDFFCRLEEAPWEVSGPASLEPLVFASRTALRWEAPEASRSDTFNVYRSTLAKVRQGDYGTCIASGLEEPSANTLINPPVGGVFTYLVSGENVYGEGSLGQTSAGAERPNLAPCP